MSSYTYGPFFSVLKNLELKNALEVGSLHGLDAIQILKTYNLEKVTVIECNPECIEICKKNFANYPKISLIEFAAWHEDTEMSFYPVVNSIDTHGNISHKNDMHKCNIGASSCYRTNDTWPYEKYTQTEIKVQAKRLDNVLKNLNIESIDLICMDIQGAELNALKGLGDYLKNVKAIITELELEPMYHNQSLFLDVQEYLKKFDFELKYSNLWAPTAGDFLFIKR